MQDIVIGLTLKDKYSNSKSSCLSPSSHYRYITLLHFGVGETFSIKTGNPGASKKNTQKAHFEEYLMK